VVNRECGSPARDSHQWRRTCEPLSTNRDVLGFRSRSSGGSTSRRRDPRNRTPEYWPSWNNGRGTQRRGSLRRIELAATSSSNKSLPTVHAAKRWMPTEQEDRTLGGQAISPIQPFDRQHPAGATAISIPMRFCQLCGNASSHAHLAGDVSFPLVYPHTPANRISERFCYLFTELGVRRRTVKRLKAQLAKPPTPQ
jgi:hypothetical protein